MPVVPRVIEIYADTRSVGQCSGRSCRRRILWATIVKTGKKMCFDDPELVALETRHDPDSRRLIETVDLSLNHWSTCVDRQDFTRR